MEKEEIQEAFRRWAKFRVQGIWKEKIEELILEFLEQYKNPPNLDNLLELARERANNTFENGGGLNELSRKIAFIEGAKFIIDKLKELGND